VAAPVVLALLGLVVLAGRVESAHQVVNQAAEDAARAASIARSQGSATDAAHAAAGADLSGRDCQHWNLSLSGSFAPGSVVSAQIACTTSLGILPGSFTATSHASSVVDVYRGALP
jgi:hypothetical protein